VKAFDTVNHSSLLAKLNWRGTNGLDYNFRVIFKEHETRVRINDA